MSITLVRDGTHNDLKISSQANEGGTLERRKSACTNSGDMRHKAACQ